MPTISLRVNGRNYRFGCEAGEEERLQSLAAHLDGHLKSLVAQHGAVGDERLLMMASLMVADELFEARAQIEELEASAPQRTRRSGRKAMKVKDQTLESAAAETETTQVAPDGQTVLDDDVTDLSHPIAAE